MLSSKGRAEICHDEPVAFFATEEDWYVELEMRVQYILLNYTDANIRINKLIFLQG